MDYRKFGECYYIRMDCNDEIISTILEICKKENIRSATFSVASYRGEGILATVVKGVCNFNIFHSSCTGCIWLFLYADTIHGFPVMDRFFSILLHYSDL